MSEDRTDQFVMWISKVIGTSFNIKNLFYIQIFSFLSHSFGINWSKQLIETESQDTYYKQHSQSPLIEYISTHLPNSGRFSSGHGKRQIYQFLSVISTIVIVGCLHKIRTNLESTLTCCNSNLIMSGHRDCETVSLTLNKSIFPREIYH